MPNLASGVRGKQLRPDLVECNCCEGTGQTFWDSERRWVYCGRCGGMGWVTIQRRECGEPMTYAFVTWGGENCCPTCDRLVSATDEGWIHAGGQQRP